MLIAPIGFEANKSRNYYIASVQTYIGNVVLQRPGKHRRERLFFASGQKESNDCQRET